MIFSENRCPARIKSGAGFFGIMLCSAAWTARSHHADVLVLEREGADALRQRVIRAGVVAIRGEIERGHGARTCSLEHDPEKWKPVFGKDHAPPKS